VPSNTPPPTITPAPTPVPTVRGMLTPDMPAWGSITGAGAAASRDLWTFEGMQGRSITITDFNPKASVSIFDPDGILLLENNDPMLGPLALTVTGTYSALVQPRSSEPAGAYSLTLTVSRQG
jgi:hypothetical protein